MILSIDQGTTGTTVMIFNQYGHIQGRTYNEFTQIYPKAGWVEHDPMEIWNVTMDTIKAAMKRANISVKEITAIGITNQRETTVVWDRETSEPLHNAIVWQCRRSAPLCNAIKSAGMSDWLKAKTGLVVDAYFSATKLSWLFQEHPHLLKRAQLGTLCFGTIDSWLIWKLTGGKSHVTDMTNASRTMLFNIETLEWDQELLDYFEIPFFILPKVHPSVSDFGKTSADVFWGGEIPITGVAGDQQAALFGQRCTQKGMAKNTYGTGCFMLMYTGDKHPISKNGLLTTVACNSEGKPAYALEGAVFTAGAAVQWLRDELGIIRNAFETEAIAKSIPHSNGVFVVPAFTGLGAPYWDMDVRAAILGLTRGTGKREIVRATLEAIAYQTRDLAELMSAVSGLPIQTMRVDGGASANDFLMQFQADILNIEIQRPQHIDSTVIGAALLAGIGSGLWKHDHLPDSLSEIERNFNSQISTEDRRELYQDWKNAVKQTRNL